MLKRRLTSIEGVTALLATLASNSGSDAAAIAIIQGDETVAGSLAKMLADSKAYSDSVTASVDLSQVTANTAAITTLNADDATDGSIRKGVKDAMITHDANEAQAISGVKAQLVDVNTAAIADIMGDTAPTSITLKTNALLNGASELYDTLGEIDAALALSDTESSNLTNTIATNKSNLEGSIAVLDKRIDEVTAEITAAIAAGKVALQAELDAELAILRSKMDGKLFKRASLLGEINVCNNFNFPVLSVTDGTYSAADLLVDGSKFEYVPAVGTPFIKEIVVAEDTSVAGSAQYVEIKTPIDGYSQTVAGAKQMYRFDKSSTGKVYHTADVVVATVNGGGLDLSEVVEGSTREVLLPANFTLTDGVILSDGVATFSLMGYPEPVTNGGATLVRCTFDATDPDNPDTPVVAFADQQVDLDVPTLRWIGEKSATDFSEDAPCFSDVNQTIVRRNIGAYSADEVSTKFNTWRPVNKISELVVTNGEVVVPNIVAGVYIMPEHIKWARIHYPDGFDNVRLEVGAAVNTFSVYDETPGDLDGTTVSLRYIEPQRA